MEFYKGRICRRLKSSFFNYSCDRVDYYYSHLVIAKKPKQQQKAPNQLKTTQ